MMQTGAQVADKAVQGILSRIDALAEKIGTTAANVWNVYLAQARVEAIRDTLAGVVLLLGAFAVFRFILFAGNKVREIKNEDGYGGDGWSVIAAVSSVGLFIVLGLSISRLYGAVGEWLNPQYWAFQHLTADIKNLF